MSDTPRTDALLGKILEETGVLNQQNSPEPWVNLCREIEREKARLREVIESVARELAKGDAVAFQCYVDLNETIIDLYGRQIPLANGSVTCPQERSD